MEEYSLPEKFQDEENQSKAEQSGEVVNEDIESKPQADDLSVNIGGPAPGQMSREEIEESLSQIYNQLEEKRKEDGKVVEEVIKEIMAQAKRSCEVLEQNMLQMHETKKKELDDEAQKLIDILNDIKQAETELETSKDSLRCLCQEIQKSIL